jgi:hypothetical protein
MADDDDALAVDAAARRAGRSPVGGSLRASRSERGENSRFL